MIDFLWPWAVAFLPLPLLVYFLVPAASRTDAALQVPFYVVASHYEGDSSFNQRRTLLRRIILILMWLCLMEVVWTSYRKSGNLDPNYK